MAKETGRVIYIDALRILAAFLVIFNHTAGYHLFLTSGEGFKTWIYMLCAMVTRINVPIFLMIAGALLLKKEESYIKLIKVRFLRIFTVTLIASAVVYILRYKQDANLVSFLYDVIEGKINTPYWYLYAYMGLILLLPLLRKIVVSFTTQDFEYLLVMRFVFMSLIPILQYIMNASGVEPFVLNGNLVIPVMTERILFYPLTGYYLANVLDNDCVQNKHIAAAILIMISGIFLSCLITYHAGITDEFSQNYVMLFDYLSAIVVFFLVRYIFEKQLNGRIGYNLAKIITRVGSLTFGIYLMDPVLSSYLRPRIEPIFAGYIPVLITSILWCITSMIICGTVTFWLKKLPIIKNLL